MRLIIGARGQGKRTYARSLGYEESQMDCRLGDQAVVTELEGIVARLLEAGKDPVAEVLRHAAAHPAAVYLCAEVGCGVVPVDRFQREWREAVGRVCCALAREADRVERIFCGLPMTLKGEKV